MSPARDFLRHLKSLRYPPRATVGVRRICLSPGALNLGVLVKGIEESSDFAISKPSGEERARHSSLLKSPSWSNIFYLLWERRGIANRSKLWPRSLATWNNQLQVISSYCI